jgi:hypothetical protein
MIRQRPLLISCLLVALSAAAGLYLISLLASSDSTPVTYGYGMWETVNLRPHEEPDGNDLIASTELAIELAKQFFDTTNLVGLKSEQVEQIVGQPESWKSSYNFPFYGRDISNSIVYRFDSGFFGWEFEVVFDDEGKVMHVLHKSIE